MKTVIDKLNAALQGGFNVAAKAAVMHADGRMVATWPGDAAPSLAASISTVQEFFGDDWQDGDVAILNDVNQGATHGSQLTAVAPRFGGGKISGWTASRVNVPDLGGWLPGGYSPQAVDRWAEAARFVRAKLLRAGRERREVSDLLRLNSRTPKATRHLALAAANAALELGRVASPSDFEQAWSLDSATLVEKLQRVAGKVATASSKVALPAGWAALEDIKVEVYALGERLRIVTSGPAHSWLPVNLGEHASRDLVVAAVAAVLGAQRVETGALASLIEVQIQGELLAAPTAAGVGLGRETTGAALHAATCEAAATVLGRHAPKDAMQAWLRRETVGALDWSTGKLDADSASRLLSIESEIPQ
ncbi:hydantoinase B/oxoprolinase family protein [Variovorax sp. E3]|uniref:hydantoinase B/oxoprolinase family protein n=1 Tax=Variovorax sp. E3 TaxID=1914993 RepID=UPI0018DEB495|nr:hydantoinase B/oxoprolinase family protein [Variovorax sp. E3]